MNQNGNEGDIGHKEAKNDVEGNCNDLNIITAGEPEAQNLALEKTSSLTSRLQKLRLPLSRSQTGMDSLQADKALSRPGPFAHYRQQILNSQSRIILL